ncbi:Acetyl esterase/lipase [Pseudoxanthomonas sp. GM95]|uniref:alpha/beta hydrolase n=1 Tax=Pseudoxanthomonas sp. GM95 TaxID=1881043 RepID=UPI0008CC5223|nr:alpha/beta hydrolase [Pseudoxanthomonas sp. GM95]SEM19192.1 Acetyl esterase/lipase [Pseudoxanthomonas sp. GM95]
MQRLMRTMRGCVACLVLATMPAWAQTHDAPTETLTLWPEGSLPQVVKGPEKVGKQGSATGSVSQVSNPRIEIYRAAHPNGTAALIVGGGGYFRIQVGSAARPMAQWLASIGVTSAVLYYRLPGDGWKAEAPFQDAQRAMRLMRSHAADWQIDANKIGIIGSSAGANLSGIIATRWDHDFYPRADAADALSARPDFLAMLYPVVSVKPPLDKTRSARELSTQSDYLTAYSVEDHVRADMPPVFLAQAVDDPIVDVGHSLLMYQTALKAKVPVELHIFERGGHSWGLGKPGSEPAQWPRLFATWARMHGFMRDANAPALDPASPTATDGD